MINTIISYLIIVGENYDRFTRSVPDNLIAAIRIMHALSHGGLNEMFHAYRIVKNRGLPCANPAEVVAEQTDTCDQGHLDSPA
jgi:hypothetical protein